MSILKHDSSYHTSLTIVISIISHRIVHTYFDPFLRRQISSTLITESLSYLTTTSGRNQTKHNHFILSGSRTISAQISYRHTLQQSMPVQSRPVLSPAPSPAMHDSALRHPAFFTERLRPSPSSVAVPVSQAPLMTYTPAWASPITHGYIYQPPPPTDGSYKAPPRGVHPKL